MTVAEPTPLIDESVAHSSRDPACNFSWPVFRLGRVLRLAGEQRLRVETAQKLGTLFAASEPASVRYLTRRRQELAALAAEHGAVLSHTWGSRDRFFGSKAVEELRRRWQPDAILVTYSFVPVVRLPDFLLEIGPCLWHARESLTVCGYPSLSKVWLTASLVGFEGAPTDSAPLSGRDVTAAMAGLHRFGLAAIESLQEYYQRVLAEDALSLNLEEVVPADGFGVDSEVRIVSLAASNDLGKAFDELDREGFTTFHQRLSDNGFPGADLVADFLRLTESLPGDLTGGTWTAGTPKILDIFADQPSCGTVRSLVIPYLSPPQQRICYTALAEVREKPLTTSPISEAASRSLAREYGRSF